MLPIFIFQKSENWGSDLLEGLSSFAVVLAVAVALALILLAIGNDIAPKGPDTPGKLAPYACGEDIPATRVNVNIENFFIYAVYFMVFDVLGFVLATTLARPSNIILPLGYAAASLVSIAILTAKWRK
jgi:NADH:ubiquinone oxidoreductase subunit 3 (subunit A)